MLSWAAPVRVSTLASPPAAGAVLVLIRAVLGVPILLCKRCQKCFYITDSADQHAVVPSVTIDKVLNCAFNTRQR